MLKEHGSGEAPDDDSPCQRVLTVPRTTNLVYSLEQAMVHTPLRCVHFAHRRWQELSKLMRQLGKRGRMRFCVVLDGSQLPAQLRDGAKSGDVLANALASVGVSVPDNCLLMVTL